MLDKDRLKSKLLDITEELKVLKNTQKEILENIAKKNYENIVKSKYTDKKDQEYYLEVYEIVYDDETIEEILSDNPIALQYYQQNADTYDTLLTFALDMYKLSDGIKINDLEDLEVTRIKVAKEKKILSVKDVELIYGFSKFQQADFRGRIMNPLPYIKSSTNSRSANTKISYKKDAFEHWIDNFY